MFKQLLLDSFFFSLLPLLNKALSLITLPIITTHLSPADFGLYSSISNLLSIFSIVFGLGLDATLLRQYQELSENSRILYSSNIVRLSLSFSIPATFVLSLLFLSFPQLGIGKEFNSYLLTSLIFLPFFPLLGIGTNYFRISFQKKNFFILNLISTVLNYFLVPFMIIYFKMKTIALIFGVITPPFLGTLFFLMKTQVSPLKPLHKPFVEQIFHFAIPLLPTILFNNFVYLTDRYFIQRLLGFEQLGIFSLGMSFASILTFAIGIFQTSWSPIAYKEYSKPGAEGKFKQVFFGVFCLFTFFAFAATAFRKDLVSWLAHPAYNATAGIFPFLMILALIQFVFFFSSQGLILANNVKYYSYSFVVGGLINVPLNVLFISSLGINGALFASILSFSIMIFFVGVLYRKYSAIKVNPIPYLSFCLLLALGAHHFL